MIPKIVTLLEGERIILAILGLICVGSALMGTFLALTILLERRNRRAQFSSGKTVRASVGDIPQRLNRRIDALLERSSLPLAKRIAYWRGRTQKRRANEQIIADLPHMIDIITLSVAAGLPFDQALSSYVEATDGLLAHHFKLALQYWQTGLKLRSEALDDVVSELESREVARFVSALQQSLVLGTALVYVLEAQGSEARDAHKQHVETKIAKTPVKMLIPMATCIIPSLLLLLLGPVVIDVMRGLGSGL